ncbi:MAG: NAD(P)H-dependent oxidoreductase subunit E [Kiritimatiellae bacterium]|nr:NAD(P)H-dependent oxidoreductase subunit E [Kiritimatiellia bacterium]MDD5523161.1 NAD(P)H-dependent oxidoreductase subunit E [Kiritimatiellia bacterium]
MSENLGTFIKNVCHKYKKDKTRLMDIACEVQEQFGCVSGKAMDLIAGEISIHRVEVENLVSFYAFLSKEPKGKIVIRLCNDIIDELNGAEEVAKAFSEELGIKVGQTTADGKITLEYTPCIGMCDQAPAAMVNDVIVTNLNSDKARKIAHSIKKHGDPSKLSAPLGDGNNANELVLSMVNNNIRQKGEVIFARHEQGAGLTKALSLSPVEVIRDIKTARLRGRGGAGFPTGMKWEFARQATGTNRYVICNADEGEPGTFKDRVILTECPDLMFEGMTIAGYAIGSETGILYLRGEYAYLRAFLEKILSNRRKNGMLGKDVGGKKGFNFDIRIQMGAGAYICGEETALISSCEGLRGDPKTRPPFPAQKGYLASPTTVNNVETFCCVARILDKGAPWFTEIGSQGSPSTKLLSVSGDCKKPGVYEVPFGIKVSDLLKMVGAEDTAAVQVGGPSGQMIGPADFKRTICYDDLATGGSIMIFNSTRDVLRIASKFMEFFVEESCGYCTPCRTGNVLLKERLDRIIAGKGEPSDLDYLQELGESVKVSSRCGMGQTSPNPVLSTLKNFRGQYEKLTKRSKDGLMQSFDIKAAIADAEAIAGRPSEKFSLNS